MSPDDATLDEQMAVVTRRLEFIDLLAERGPLATRDVVDAVSQSRSTVTRALGELRDAGLVGKRDGGYEASVAGTMAAEQYRRHETAMGAIFDSRELLAPIPESHAPPVEFLTGAETILADEDIPVRPLEAISERVRGADAVRAYLPTLVNTHLLRVWHRVVVDDGVDSEALFDPDLLTVLKGQYPQILSEMAAADDFSAFAVSGPPYGVFLTTHGKREVAGLVVYEDGTAVRGVVVNDTDDAVEWATDVLGTVRSEADAVTDDFAALSAALTDGTPTTRSTGHQRPQRADLRPNASHALPLALAEAGFIRLSPASRDTHEAAPPEVSWRTGLALADVRAGHAVHRRDDDDGQNLTERLLDGLSRGRDHVVLGPPGTGKSTVCQSVASEWDARDFGSVLYRPYGRGDPFDAPALLEAYLRQHEADVLVVVEDAVRESADALFRVVRALEDAEHVSFLLDARTREWEDIDTFSLDPRLDNYRRTALEQVRVPAFDERECERFVEHFRSLVGDPGISGAELFASLDGADGDDASDVTPGSAVHVQYRLSRHHDPASDAPTALDAAVARTYRRIADGENTLALDIAVTSAALHVAGVSVRPAYLSAVAADDEFGAVDDALSALEGELLFDQRRHRPTQRPATYRLRHETWSRRFLETFVEQVPDGEARERFGRCLTRVLALADRPDQRDRIERHRDGRTPGLHQIAADPETWADNVSARLFGIGRTNPALAPLFGDTDGSALTLPDACSPKTHLQQAYWRGEMNRVHGAYERAEREFQTLRDRAQTVAVPTGVSTTPSAPAGAHVHDTDETASETASTRRAYWQALALTKLGTVSRERGNLETAEDRLREARSLFREIDDRHGEATVLLNLGALGHKRGTLEDAATDLEEALDNFRDVGDRHGEGKALLNLGAVAHRRKSLDTATEYFDASLDIFRQTADRHREGLALLNLGAAAGNRGDLSTAIERLEASLAAFRDIGARRRIAHAHHSLGEMASKRGDLDTAGSSLREGLALARDIEARAMETLLRISLGNVDRKRGDLETAAEQFQRSLDAARETGARPQESLALVHLGMVAREREQYDDAAAYVDEGLTVARDSDARRETCLARLEEGIVSLERGDHERASSALEESLTTARDSADQHLEARCLYALGRLARARDAPERAQSRLTAAAEAAFDMGAGVSRDIVDELVDLCETRGDAETATEWCDRAVEFARETDRKEMRRHFDGRRSALDG
ncbi:MULTISPECIES: tetratricopeptide repeat protein [Salinibaculum]|uniref:tetratricopeptide repeat protein n=1 Tax=Salinibaculum TaxID=2732368 RepID=UPI0030CE71C8